MNQPESKGKSVLYPIPYPNLIMRHHNFFEVSKNTNRRKYPRVKVFDASSYSIWDSNSGVIVENISLALNIRYLNRRRSNIGSIYGN